MNTRHFLGVEFLASGLGTAMARVLGVLLMCGFQGAAFGAEPDLLAPRHPAAPVSATATGESGGARLSVRGRFLLFVSTADDLVPGTHNGTVADLFVRDQVTGEVTLVSVTPDGQRGGDGNSYQGAISEDGRWVAFESDAGNLVAGEPPTVGVGFFLRDRLNQTTRRILLPLTQGPILLRGEPLEAPIATDAEGRRIAMVHGGLVFLHDRESALTVNLTQPLVSDPPVGVTLRSTSPQFDGSGRLLVFGSSVPNLVRPAAGAARAFQLYVYRLDRGNFDPTNLTQIRLTNAQLPVVTGGYPVADFSLNRDGKTLTAAVVPTTGATEALGVLRFDLVSGEVQPLAPGMPISRGSTFSLATFDPDPAGPQESRQRVAFELLQGISVPGSYTNGLFVWESDGSTETLKHLRVSAEPQARALTGTPVEFSPDGRRLLISSADTNVVPGLSGFRTRYALVDVGTGVRTLAVPDEAEARNLILSDADGGVVFESTASNLVEGDLNLAGDLFQRDGTVGNFTLISRRDATAIPRTAAGFSALGERAFSANGDRWVLTSVSDDLVPEDSNSAEDVFVRDRADGRLRLVSVQRDGAATGNGPSGQPVISSDGNVVAFVSGATNLVADDANDRPDLFVRNLSEGSTSLVSPPPGGAVMEFSMSADARKFLWIRREFPSYRVQYRDLDGGGVRTLLSNVNCSSPVLSADGSVGMFLRDRLLMVFDPRTEAPPVRVPAATLRFDRILMNADASRVVCFAPGVSPFLLVRKPDGTYEAPTPLPDDADAASKQGVLSPDGRWLAYAGAPYLLQTARYGNMGYRVVLMDLQQGSRTVVDRGLLGLDPDGDSDRPAFSSDGRYLAFRTAAGNLVADDDNASDDVAVLDRVTGGIRLVSRLAPSGEPWAAGAFRATFGGRPEELWVASRSADLTPGDYNAGADGFRLTLPVDSDGDGMDDSLERLAFEGLKPTGTGDEDQDGVSNADELVAGTDPRSPDSVLHLDVQSIAPDRWKAVWASIPGRRYRVAVADAAEGPWRAVNPVVTAVALQTESLLPEFNGGQAGFVQLLMAE
ncbi:MAG: PD40 domain-containing protein [Verrucomicrobiales bacterium]|nr:PD40 domain-containing protein [Verrucomicrobiales bacterium]